MSCFKVKFLKWIWNFHWSKILLQRYVFFAIFPFDLTQATSTVEKCTQSELYCNSYPGSLPELRLLEFWLPTFKVLPLGSGVSSWTKSASSIGMHSGSGLIMIEGIERLTPLLPLTNVEQVPILEGSTSFKISSSPLSLILMSGFLESFLALASALICSLLCLLRFFRTFRSPKKILTLRKTSKIKGRMTVVMVQVQWTYPMM